MTHGVMLWDRLDAESVRCHFYPGSRWERG